MYPREIGHTQLASVLGAKGLCYPGPPDIPLLPRHLLYLGWEPARGLPVPVACGVNRYPQGPALQRQEVRKFKSMEMLVVQ